MEIVPEPARPRVGLVLGGGGARGAAHIGVLRELERLRVPVDAIVGTSMGAVVGGLYASGMSVDDLDELVRTLDWGEALSDQPDRADLSFRRKLDDARFPINLELGYRDDEFQLPQGAIQGHNLDLLLRRLTLHVSDVDDFDDLPVRFRAIGSDIVAAEPYVMASGDLALAIRASMSVPGVIAPVMVDGHLLVDGGIVGNLGVDVMQALDVDVIIAVDVEFPLYPIEELDSVVAISEQMLTIAVRKETVRQIAKLGDQDILIQPKLGTFGSTDFGNAGDVIEPGANAAAALEPRLRKLSVDERAWQSFVASRTNQPQIDSEVGFVRVLHDDDVPSAVLASRMTIVPGDPVDADVLEAEANRLNGLQLYERVGYRLVGEGGETGVEFTAQPKTWGPNLLRFGLSIEDDFEGSTSFNVMSRLVRHDVNLRGGELLADVRLGTDPQFGAELYQPFSAGSPFFYSPRFVIGQRNVNAFGGNDNIARLRLTETRAAVDAGVALGTIGEIRAGIYRGGGEARVKVGDPSLPNIDFETGGGFLRFRIDTLDNAQFPRRGSFVNLDWNAARDSLGADVRFDTVVLDTHSAWSRGRSTLAVRLNYATTLNGTLPIYEQFSLGGFLRLSGLERGEMAGQHAGIASLVYMRRISDTDRGILRVPVYVGGSLEAGNVWQSRDSIGTGSLLVNGSLFLGIDTYIGPLYLAAGFAERGSRNFYLFVGAPPR